MKRINFNVYVDQHDSIKKTAKRFGGIKSYFLALHYFYNQDMREREKLAKTCPDEKKAE